MDWTEKFKKKHEKVIILDKKFGELNPGEKMLISSPKSIYNFIKNIHLAKLGGQSNYRTSLNWHGSKFQNIQNLAKINMFNH